MELFVVATPIGNLGDASPRLCECLAQVDVIAAEDTRRARHLLELLKISAPKIVHYFDHNEQQSAEGVIQLLKQNKKVALLSDAGTPCISDPGYRVVAAAHKEQIKVTPIPGPSALTTIVQASGLPSDCLTFVGFLPRTSEARLKDFGRWKDFPGSIVFYETAQRIVDAFTDLNALYPEALCALGRELTKLHEEVLQKSTGEMLAWLKGQEQIKGEIAVMIDLRSYREIAWTQDQVDLEIVNKLADGLSTKDVVKELTKASGLAKDGLYKRVLQLRDKL